MTGLRRQLPPLIAALLLAQAVWGQIEEYRVGAGGLDWESQVEAAGGVRFDDSGAMLPIGLVSTDNIVRDLRWIGATTEDFIGEGDAHVWDNAAIEGDTSVLVDGDPSTSTGNRFKTLGVVQTGRRFFLDLGAAFPANRIIFFASPEFEDDFPRAYELSTSDGRSYTVTDQPRYQVLRRVDLQTESVAETVFPEQLVRFIQLRVLSPSPFEIAEFEIYGEGFVPKGIYRSQLIRLPSVVNLGTMTVETTMLRRREDGTLEPAPDAEAMVNVELRNGADDTPLIHHEIVDRETGSERPTTGENYDTLAEDFRGSVIDDRDNWTRENPLLIDSTGTHQIALDLPGPRDYIDYRMTFLGTPSDIIRVESLSVSYSEPLADRAVAEASLAGSTREPGEALTVPEGQDMLFYYDARAEFSSASQPGFDGIHIRTQSEPEFVRFEMGDPLVEAMPDSVRISDSGLSVYFPSRRVRLNNNQPIRVTFRTAILVYATDLGSQLLDTRGSLPQPVGPGDVDGDGYGPTRVFFDKAGQGRVISDLTLSTPIVTPNGDGVNDTVELSFGILRLVKAIDFELRVYDLSGHLVRRLNLGGLAAGRYSQAWDGRDHGGEPVPPGVYVVRLGAATETGDESLVQTLGVAY